MKSRSSDGDSIGVSGSGGLISGLDVARFVTGFLEWRLGFTNLELIFRWSAKGLWNYDI